MMKLAGFLTCSFNETPSRKFNYELKITNYEFFCSSGKVLFRLQLFKSPKTFFLFFFPCGENAKGKRGWDLGAVNLQQRVLFRIYTEFPFIRFRENKGGHQNHCKGKKIF